MAGTLANAERLSVVAELCGTFNKIVEYQTAVVNHSKRTFFRRVVTGTVDY